MTRFITSLLFLALTMTSSVLSAQDDSRFGTDSLQIARCKENMSLFDTYYKQKNYDDAYVFCQKACEVCPPGNFQTLYQRGVSLLKRQMKAALKDKNQERAIALRDSVFLFYDLRIEHFPSTSKKPDNGCEVLGRKAIDWVNLNKRSAAEARPMFEESISCLEGRSLAASFDKYYSLLKTAFMDAEGAEAKTAAQEDLLLEYLRLSDFIEAGRQNELAAGDSAGADKYANTQKNLDEVFVQVANCDEMVPVLEGKLNAAPDDIEIKKTALRLMDKKRCSENDLYLPLAEAVYVAEKNASSAFGIGKKWSKKGDYAAALPYFEEAVEMCGDCPEQAQYLESAAIAAKNVGQRNKCKSLARRWAKMDPTNGEPYLLLGDVIVDSINACSDSPLGGREVYWLATDYYERAKSVDSEVASKANAKISQVSKSYPTVDDLFTYGIDEGKEITVKCLGETTKARKP